MGSEFEIKGNFRIIGKKFMATVLKIENLHKSFKLGFLLKKKEILRGISLSVEQGEVFGYLGPNGAGKTTTIKCILGLIFPEKGNIEIFGHPYLSPKAWAICRSRAWL